MCTTFNGDDDDAIEAMFHWRYKLLRMRINICDPMTPSWPQWKRQRKHLKCSSMFILFYRFFCCDSFYRENYIVWWQCLLEENWNVRSCWWAWQLYSRPLVFHSHVQYMHSVCDMSPCAWYVWILENSFQNSSLVFFPSLCASFCFVLCGIPLMLYCNLIC